MTTPPVYTSILKRKEQELGLGSSSGFHAVSYWYYQTTLDIRSQFFRQKMADMSEAFIDVIESDLRTMIDTISSDLEIKDRELAPARKSLDVVYREVTTWQMLVSEKDSDPKASNIRERNKALINARNALEKAIKYWPKKGFEQYKPGKSES